MNEGPRVPRWVVRWLVVSALIQAYDAGFVLTKPLSDPGGPLGFLWPGHHLYGRYDGRYATFDAFGSAQSWANLVEVLLIAYLWPKRATRRGALLALVVCVMTFWKTVIYFLVEICGHLGYTRHVLDAGDAGGFVGVVIAPNLVWIVVPALAIVALLRRLDGQGSASSPAPPSLGAGSSGGAPAGGADPAGGASATAAS